MAGFRHYEGMHLLTQMKEGDLLELVREPQSEYDSCAIALHYQNKKIGFIPADTNEMLSYLLDADALSMFAVITHLEKNTQPWESVAVAIYFVQEENKSLPAHASYLTRIEAPHYRTLKKNKGEATSKPKAIAGFEDLMNSSCRIIDLDKIPKHQQEAKKELMKHYAKHAVEMKEKGHYL